MMITEAGEMAQWLGMLPALPESSTWYPGQLLIQACSSSSRGADAVFWLPWVSAHIHSLCLCLLSLPLPSHILTPPHN